MSRWESLLVVQEHDTRADQLAHRIETLPARAELAKLEDAGAALDRQLTDVQRRRDELAVELGEVRAEREAAAKSVPDELWTEYDELRSRLGGVAIARLAGTTCQGCHLALSAVEVDRIRKVSLDEAVHCEECGRLLVRD